MGADANQKEARVEKQALAGEELALINRQALKELTAEEVFVFRVAACDNQVDRDQERFTEAALARLAELYVGKTVIMDHRWSANGQTARIYAGAVEESEGVQRLVLRVYMLRNDQTAPLIAAIEGGILREVSVGCQVAKAICSICGTDRRETYCGHCPGQEYEGKRCHIDLDEPTDAYEMSFVAVPAQKEAGVIKHYGGKGEPDTLPRPGEEAPDLTLRMRFMDTSLALMEMEE